jgi:RNA polymerase sigma-70 factor (ECF subfamily)
VGETLQVEDTWRRGAPALDGAEQLDRLAASAAHGDRLAFEQVYYQTVDDLFTYVRGQCRSETTAEDIVSNTYYKAWRSASRYRAGSNGYRQWLFGIARNELRNFWASNHATLSLGDFDVPDEAHLEVEQDQADARAEVARLMDGLTEPQRQVVSLRYFNGKSHEEIARIMGKREGAVRALLLRALRQMRKEVSDATT